MPPPAASFPSPQTLGPQQSAGPEPCPSTSCIRQSSSPLATKCSISISSGRLKLTLNEGQSLEDGLGTASLPMAFLISFLSRRTAFTLPSPYIGEMKTPKISRREQAQSSSRVVSRLSAHLKRSWMLNEKRLSPRIAEITIPVISWICRYNGALSPSSEPSCAQNWTDAGARSS